MQSCEMDCPCDPVHAFMLLALFSSYQAGSYPLNLVLSTVVWISLEQVVVV